MLFFFFTEEEYWLIIYLYFLYWYILIPFDKESNIHPFLQKYESKSVSFIDWYFIKGKYFVASLRVTVLI